MSIESGEGYRPPGAEEWKAPETGQEYIEKGVEEYRAKEAQEIMKSAVLLNNRFDDRSKLFGDTQSSGWRAGSGEVDLGINPYTEKFSYQPRWEGEEGKSDQVGATIDIQGLPDRDGYTETKFFTISPKGVDVISVKSNDSGKPISEPSRPIAPHEQHLIIDSINRATNKLNEIIRKKEKERQS